MLRTQADPHHRDAGRQAGDPCRSLLLAEVPARRRRILLDDPIDGAHGGRTGCDEHAVWKLVRVDGGGEHVSGADRLTFRAAANVPKTSSLPSQWNQIGTTRGEPSVHEYASRAGTLDVSSACAVGSSSSSGPPCAIAPPYAGTRGLAVRRSATGAPATSCSPWTSASSLPLCSSWRGSSPSVTRRRPADGGTSPPSSSWGRWAWLRTGSAPPAARRCGSWRGRLLRSSIRFGALTESLDVGVKA